MAKSEETIKLEQMIYQNTKRLGLYGCFEVTIGWCGKERVDYITYDTKGVWRCYEIKVSKSDFYSKAKKTFVGNYNYFVMPHSLFSEVEKDIPNHVGVICCEGCVKKSKMQPLQVDEHILKNSMIRSLSREYERQYISGIETEVNKLEKQIRKYELDVSKMHRENILLTRKCIELEREIRKLHKR